MSLFAQVRRITYISASRLDAWLGRTPQGVTIMCYHSVADDEWLYSTKPADFTAQIDLLLTYFTPMSVSELEATITHNLPVLEPRLVITFDDGYQNITSVAPYLYTRGITPTVFLLAQPEAANRDEMATQKSLLNKTDVAYLQEMGWEIGSHTATHPNLSNCTPSQLESEIITAKQRLEHEFGVGCKWIAYPRGQYTPEVIATAKRAGYTMGFTMDDGAVNPSKPLLIPRIGINNSHTPQEVVSLASPSNVIIRKLIKTFC